MNPLHRIVIRPPFPDLFVCLFSMNCAVLVSPTDTWMEEHSLEPFAVNSECTCEWLHSPVNLVNSEHKSDCVNSAFSLRKEPVNERLKNLRKQHVNGESEWWPLRPEQISSRADPLIETDFWEGDATKHFSVKRRVLQWKGGRQYYHQRKIKGQQLKGKTVSHFFAHFFSHLFHTFSPWDFPFKTKGFSSMRTQKRRKDKKNNRTNRCCTIVVARLSSSYVNPNRYLQGQILAMWILAVKLPNSDLNFAVPEPRKGAGGAEGSRNPRAIKFHGRLGCWLPPYNFATTHFPAERSSLITL